MANFDGHCCTGGSKPNPNDFTANTIYCNAVMHPKHVDTTDLHDEISN